MAISGSPKKPANSETTQGSSQKSLVIKIFAVGHLKIVDFPALAKNVPRVPEKSLRLFRIWASCCRFYKKAMLFCRNSTPNAVGGTICQRQMVGGIFDLHGTANQKDRISTYSNFSDPQFSFQVVRSTTIFCFLLYFILISS